MFPTLKQVVHHCSIEHIRQAGILLSFISKTTMSVTKNTFPAETSRIDILKSSDVLHYLQKITQDSNATTFTRDASDLKHDFIKGLTKEELKKMIEEKINEPIKRQLYDKVYELEENQTTLLATTLLKDHNARHSWVVKGMHRNGKFDLLEVHAIQRKELNRPKLLAYCLSFLFPSSGRNESVSENSQEMSLASQQLNAETPHSSNAPTTIVKAVAKGEPADVLYAYIMQDFHDKNMLNTSSENQDTWE
jgi:hypothetical protein